MDHLCIDFSIVVYPCACTIHMLIINIHNMDICMYYMYIIMYIVCIFTCLSKCFDYFNDDVTHDQEPRPSSDPHRVQSLPPRLLNEDPLSSDEEEMINDRSMSRVRQRSLRRKRFVFTNELSSQELVSTLYFSITWCYKK